jgi:carboxymethylenebutenolidase
VSETISLKAKDGHELAAYVARPAETAIAGLVVVQEIYGVNPHIRSVADGYAKDGFLVIAPALFDRIKRDVQLTYDADDQKRAMGFLRKLTPETALLDIEAALSWVREDSGKPQAGVIGYCFGGNMAWRSAALLDPQVAVGYYAGGIGDVADLEPQCPVMLHFGRKDTHIPAESVEKVHAAHPEVQIYWYDAEHAFNCEPRESFDEVSAKLARTRSLKFLMTHLA